ncbi:ABC transporter ATP-binding protein [Candidatus Saccharibacteria bacterium]|nr:ABC transporter ATP-binding protein [Candidatus Saccharibacteria bacterium]
MTKKEQQKPTWRRTMHYYWRSTKKCKLLFVGALITTPLVFVLRLVSPLILATMLEKLTLGLGTEALIAELLPLGGLLLAFEFIRNFILGPLRLWCVWEMEIRVMYDLYSIGFDVISAQSMQFHSDRFSGSLVSQLGNFVGAYERLADEFFWNIFPTVLDIAIIMIIMFPRAPLFAVAILVLMTVFLFIAAFWSKKLAAINRAEASAGNKRTGQLSDSIGNIASVKSYAREPFERHRFLTYQKEVYRTSHRSLVMNTYRNYSFDVLYLLIDALVVALMIYGQSFFGLTLATLILVVNYTTTITGDMWDIHSIFKTMNRIFGDAHEMTLNLDLEDDVVDLPGATKLEVSRAAIDFDDITFKHSDAKVPVFSDFSLEVKPGERIGLVGVSGSGKTTLTKLLLRFADVNQGKITIDGQDIKHVTQASLRKNIAYVPQETALFHRSISDNIAYGKPDATAEEIKRAAKLANADEFIKDLPSGYDTLVGERGIKLSGGQRQRIAIARAILKDAPILVLDEATSALDSESEALIQGALKELIKDRTSIVIAHRLSTVMDLDRIVVLENGKIVETGTHAELLKKGGAYARLWSRQSGAFLDEN